MPIILYIYIILYRYNINACFNYILVRLVSSFLFSSLEGQVHERLLTSINLSEFLYNSLNRYTI